MRLGGGKAPSGGKKRVGPGKQSKNRGRAHLRPTPAYAHSARGKVGGVKAASLAMLSDEDREGGGRGGGGGK